MRKRKPVKKSKKVNQPRRRKKAPIKFIVREGYDEEDYDELDDDEDFDFDGDEDDYQFWEFRSKSAMEEFLQTKQRNGKKVKHFKVYEIAKTLIPVVTIGLKFTVKK